MTRLLTSIKAGPVGWVPDARAHLGRKRRHRQTINQARKEESREGGQKRGELWKSATSEWRSQKVFVSCCCCFLMRVNKGNRLEWLYSQHKRCKLAAVLSQFLHTWRSGWKWKKKYSRINVSVTDYSLQSNQITPLTTLSHEQSLTNYELL